MKKNLGIVSGLAAATLALAACGGGTTEGSPGEGGETATGMPDQMVWSTYGTGTSTYADLAAVANSVSSNEDTAIRIITSDTAIGRVTPVRQGSADMARTGDEYIFAFEGDYDFATEDWGPQDVRVIWAPTAPHGLLVRADSGIETIEDLRGRNFPRITANPSVNNKLEAFLAYGGLTWDDVNQVEVSYSEQPGTLQDGQLDVLFQQVYGSSLFELESAVEVSWISLEDQSPERVDAVAEVAPSVEIGEFTGAPGQAEGESDYGMWYAVPLMTYADYDEESAYATVRAVNDAYEQYSGSTITTPMWSPDFAQIAPRQVPFHDGAVRYLEEEGLWTEEAEARNAELLERGEALRAGWEEFLGTDPQDIAAEWTLWKQENLTN